MNLLFIHPNMPGQYKHLARAFGAEKGHRIYFITKHRSATIPGVTRVSYAMTKQPAEGTHRYLIPASRAVLQGQQVWRVCHTLRDKEHFVPDVIIAHPGWGDTLFIKEMFPNARILSFFEFYYQAHGADVGYNEARTDDDEARVRMKNITNLMSLEQADWGVTPTVWQWSLHPEIFRSKLSVLHDGIDLEVCTPDMQASLTLPSGKMFRAGDEVMTYIARNFEPYRGFPTFMKAAEILLRERPNLHILAIGADEVSYGRKPSHGTYREQMMREVTLPAERIHFTGTLPYDQLIKAYQVSAAHLYLTYPFVLSWSMLEAMACGAALVASNTKPVLEVVEHGVNGMLVDFFSPQDVAATIHQVLDDPKRNRAMRAAARETIEKRFDVKKLLPLHMQLVRDLAAGISPQPTNEAIKAISPIAPYGKAMWSGS